MAGDAFLGRDHGAVFLRRLHLLRRGDELCYKGRLRRGRRLACGLFGGRGRLPLWLSRSQTAGRKRSIAKALAARRPGRSLSPPG